MVVISALFFTQFFTESLNTEDCLIQIFLCTSVGNANKALTTCAKCTPRYANNLFLVKKPITKLWRLPSDREKVEAVLTRLCVNPMQDKVNNIRGMALESQEEFDAALGDGSKADTVRKAFIKLRGELTHLYQMQCSLRTAAQSDSEIALVDDLLADLEKISRKAHEQTHFTYTTLEEIAALN